MATIKIDRTGTTTYPSLSDAVYAAQNDDIIRVTGGTYFFASETLNVFTGEEGKKVIIETNEKLSANQQSVTVKGHSASDSEIFFNLGNQLKVYKGTQSGSDYRTFTVENVTAHFVLTNSGYSWGVVTLEDGWPHFSVINSVLTVRMGKDGNGNPISRTATQNVISSRKDVGGFVNRGNSTLTITGSTFDVDYLNNAKLATVTDSKIIIGKTTAQPDGSSASAISFLNANTGTFTVTGASSSVTVYGTVTNSGSITVTDSPFSATGSLNNNSTTASVAAFTNSTVSIAGAVTNSKTLTVSNSTFSAGSLNNNSTASDATFTNSTVSVAGTVTNKGSITVTGSSFSAAKFTIDSSSTGNTFTNSDFVLTGTGTGSPETVLSIASGKTSPPITCRTGCTAMSQTTAY